MVKYTYDAYGKCLSITGENVVIGTLNPFRYKGCYYDAESGMYYCKSRYYVPEWGRWLNYDSADALDVQNIIGLNLYAYCANNPIMYKQGTVCKANITTTAPLYNAIAIDNTGILEKTSSSDLNYVIANITLFDTGLFFGQETVTGLYANGYARAQFSFLNGKSELGAFGKFSLLNITDQLRIGNSDINLTVIHTRDFGTLTGFAGFKLDSSAETYFVGIDAKVAVGTSRYAAKFKLFDKNFEIGASVSALYVGSQFGIGFKDGEFYCTAGGGKLFGFDIYIRIKF